ncbi:MAG: PKD domain-containing protein [Bacteroidia bacterium]
MCLYKIKYFLLFYTLLVSLSYAQPCGIGTPTFTVNLTGHPDSLWISPSVVRNDTCCGAVAPETCVQFILTLDSAAVGIVFNIASGAIPPGALYYQVGCGPITAVGDTLCLNGPGPHIITFCKPGNNTNTYSIASIHVPIGPASIIVRNGCQGILTATGFQTSTINWTSVPFNATYNSYLSCTSGCATVTVTPSAGFPPYVDYQVSGYAQSPCSTAFFRDTVRVYFFTDLLAVINPINPTICFGSTNATLTVTATGGLTPYTYLWSTGSTATSITVGPGTYSVQVYDHSNCPPTSAIVTVTSYTVPITAEAGPDTTRCKSSPVIPLNGSVSNATGGIWSGGGGSFTPTDTTLNGNYTATAGELSAGSVQLYLTTTGNSGCPPVTDTVKISFQNVSTVNAGPDVTVCANNDLVNLSGNVSGFSTTGQWSTTGNGNFGSIINLSTTYTPGTTDISAGLVNIILIITNNGVCPPLSDTLKVTITPSTTVNAGADQTICSTSSAGLNGIVSGPTTTGIWSTLGNGTFSPNNTTLNATYTPGSNDILNGFVLLSLSSTGNGNCLTVKDTMRINITLPAIVNAGPNQTICSTTGSINLSGTVSGGTTTGIWSSSGTGIFNPNNTTLNGTYNTSATDITNGSVTFTLTSTANGPCPAVTDTMKIIITKLAIVNAGPNQTICSTTNSINLNGSISGGTTSGVWNSNGTGTFNPNTTTLNGIYNTSATDIINGGVTFILTSTANGSCPAVTDTLKLTIIKPALVNAGTDQLICSTTNSITLNGSVSGSSTTGVWSSNGSGIYNPNNTTLHVAYSISAADINNGGVLFFLTSTNNGPCAAVIDTVNLVITKPATALSGSSQTVCSTVSQVQLNGNIVGGAGTGAWSSGSTGVFNPSNINLNASYIPSASDLSSGTVLLTLNTTNNGGCPSSQSSIVIQFIKTAIVNAGLDQTICSTTTSVPLTGSITGGTSTEIWSSSGTGVFNPNNNTLNGSYNLSSLDITTGVVILTLTSTNNAPCLVVTDTMKLTIITNPKINLISDTTICSHQKSVLIHANVTGGSGTIHWSTSGSGTFNPNNATNPVNYFPSNADIANGSASLTLNSINNGPCGNIGAAVHITIHPSPTANFTPSQTTVYIPNDPITFTNHSLNANSYFWNFEDGSLSNQTSPIHNYVNVGYYTVTLTAFNQYGCTDTMRKEITVSSDIQFPNAFTPNPNGSNGGTYSQSDYSNNVFFPYTAGVTDYHLMIFNRFGELIFESFDLNIGWDGYYKGKLCQQDAYVWKAHIKFFDGRTFNKVGNVTLLR